MICVTARTEMRTGGLEIGSFTLGGLMAVHGVLAGGEPFDVEFDFYSVGRFGKSCGADGLAFGVLEFSDDGFCGRVRVRFLRNGLPGCRKTGDDKA